MWMCFIMPLCDGHSEDSDWIPATSEGQGEPQRGAEKVGRMFFFFNSQSLLTLSLYFARRLAGRASWDLISGVRGVAVVAHAVCVCVHWR